MPEELYIARVVLAFIVFAFMIVGLFTDKFRMTVIVMCSTLIALGFMFKNSIDIVCWTVVAALNANMIYESIKDKLFSSKNEKKL